MTGSPPARLATPGREDENVIELLKVRRRKEGRAERFVCFWSRGGFALTFNQPPPPLSLSPHQQDMDTDEEIPAGGVRSPRAAQSDAKQGGAGLPVEKV